MKKLTDEQQKEFNESAEFLQKCIDEGGTFILNLKHRSSNGMSRGYQVYYVSPVGLIQYVMHDVSVVTRRKISKNETIIMKGCGSDFANDLMREVAYYINRKDSHIKIYKMF